MMITTGTFNVNSSVSIIKFSKGKKLKMRGEQVDNHFILIHRHHKFKQISDISLLDIFSISVTPKCGYLENWNSQNGIGQIVKRVQSIKDVIIQLMARGPQIISHLLSRMGLARGPDTRPTRAKDEPGQGLSEKQEIPEYGGWDCVANYVLSRKSPRGKATANTKCSMISSKTIYALWILFMLPGSGTSLRTYRKLLSSIGV